MNMFPDQRKKRRITKSKKGSIRHTYSQTQTRIKVANPTEESQASLDSPYESSIYVLNPE